MEIRRGRYRILMAGPKPGEYGGIAAAAAMLLDSPKFVSGRCAVFYLSTWRWGSVLTKVLAFLLTLPRFIAWIVLKRVDLVHLHMAHGASFYRKAVLALLARAFRKPYVVQLHSARLVERAQRSRLYRRMDHFVLTRADAILVLHQQAMEDVRRLVGSRSSAIHVLPNPVDIEVTQAPTSEGGDADTKKEQRQERVKVLFLGDISPEKGVWDLLEAIPSVIAGCRPDGTQVKFIFCGRGRIAEAQRRCEELGVSASVEFLGPVVGKEKARIFQEADIFVLPSHSEELPVAVLEAMAYGLPVVATEVGGIPEAVAHGRSGLLVPIGDRERLAGALAQLIENPELRREMGEEGRRRVEAEFDRDLIVDRLISIYEAILQGKQAGDKAEGMGKERAVERDQGSPDKIDFLGYALDNLTLEEALARIESFIREGKPRMVFGLNAALFAWSLSDEQLQRVYQASDLLTVDSMGVYYASRLLGQPVHEPVSAVSLFFGLIKEAAVKGYRVYLLGAREEVVQQAVWNLRAEHPNLRIVGWHHGYLDPEDEGEVVALIREARPDILFVGMSTPLKEGFISRNLETMGVPVCIGVGGSFDIAAGLCKRAPRWVSRLCLEWLYRLIQEPGRLWKRYATTNVIFIYVVLKALVRRVLGLSPLRLVQQWPPAAGEEIEGGV